MSEYDDEFNRIVEHGMGVSAPQEDITPSPYGSLAQPHKTGLTKRGKVAIAIGVTVLAGGGILTWQHYSTQSQVNELQAQELQYKSNLLALEMQKELNKASTADQKQQETLSASQQKAIDACMNADKGLIGKQLGVTYQSVTEDCRAAYGAVNDDHNTMQEAASTTDADSSGGISPGALLGIGTGGALLIAVAANRNKKNHAA